MRGIVTMFHIIFGSCTNFAEHIYYIHIRNKRKAAEFPPTALCLFPSRTRVPFIHRIIWIELVGMIVPFSPICRIVRIMLICIVIQLLLRVCFSAYSMSFTHIR